MIFQRHQQVSSLLFTLTLLSVPATYALSTNRVLAQPSSEMSSPSIMPPSVEYEAQPTYPTTPYRPTTTVPYASRAAVVSQEYILGPGDKVRIDVYNVADYTVDSTDVLADGTIGLLQVGNIDVDGLTLEQASKLATEKYSKLLRYPSVTLTLVEPRPIRVGVTGEVTRRGSYDLSVNADLNNTAAVELPTVTRALKTAGGISQTADITKVQLRRQSNQGADQVIELNLLEFVRGTRPREDILVRDGDSIFVPAAEQLTLQESYELATSSFSAQQINPLNVTIVGEVYRPGTHTVESNVRTNIAGFPGEPDNQFDNVLILPTITRALLSAGGIKTTADIRNVTLRRATNAGEVKEYSVNLWQLLQEGDSSQDVVLQDRDMIIVPEAKSLSPDEISELATASFSPSKIQVSVVGEVDSPGIVDLQPNTPVNKAIVAAGGFNINAAKKRVRLIRLNPDGTVSDRKIAVNFAAGINDETNPALQNEDIVLVGKSTLGTVSEGLGQVFGPLAPIIGILDLFNWNR